VSYDQKKEDNLALKSPNKLLLSQHNFHNLRECLIAELSSDLMAMILQSSITQNLPVHWHQNEQGALSDCGSYQVE